jgi:hypothetical protein
LFKETKLSFQQPLATIFDEFILIIPWVNEKQLSACFGGENLPPSPKFVHHIKPASFPRFDRFSQPIIDPHLNGLV